MKKQRKYRTLLAIFYFVKRAVKNGKILLDRHMGIIEYKTHYYFMLSDDIQLKKGERLLFNGSVEKFLNTGKDLIKFKMKKTIITVIITCMITSGFFLVKDAKNNLDLQLLFSDEKENEKTQTIFGQYKSFADGLGFIVSGGRYDTILPNGSLGKYAISELGLKDLGLNPDEGLKERFLKDTALQDEAFKTLCMLNKYRLRNYIEKYHGETHHGITVTESGMIAGAHLIGATALKKWFLYTYENPELIELIEEMNGYDLEYIVPVHTFKLEE